MKEPDASIIGQDGSIQNFMKDIEREARLSNGFVLELGSGKGTGSTLAIQRGLAEHADPLHISVDVRDRLEWRPEVEWWHLVLGDTRDPLTVGRVHAYAGDRFAGLIFVDTEHTHDQIRAELPAWSLMASDDTVWLFHDTNMWNQGDAKGLVRAIQEFAAAEGWKYDDYRIEQHGLGRMTR